MQKKRLIIADEERIVLTGLASILEKEGYVVTLATNWHEVIRLVSQYHPDLILADLHMSGLSGRHALSLIKTAYPRIPVIICAAETELDTERQAQQLGVLAYLNKPIVFTDLLSRIDEAW